MDELDTNELPDNVIPLFPDEVPEIQDQLGNEMTEWVWTNDKRNPMLRQLVRMLYYSAFENKLGLMHAKVKGKDQVHTLIVGVEVNENNECVTWPIAKILTEAEQDMYLAPDGEGNYIGDDELDDASESDLSE